MAVIPVSDISLAGDSKAFQAAVGPDTFANDGRTVLYARNTNAATRDVIFDSIKPCDQGVDHNITVTVAATTGDEIIGPFPPSRFNDAAGNVTITYSAVTNLTVAAVRIP